MGWREYIHGEKAHIGCPLRLQHNAIFIERASSCTYILSCARSLVQWHRYSVGLGDAATVELLGREGGTKTALAAHEAQKKGREREVNNINLALLTLEKVGQPLSVERWAMTLHCFMGRVMHPVQTTRQESSASERLLVLRYFHAQVIWFSASWVHCFVSSTLVYEMRGTKVECHGRWGYVAPKLPKQGPIQLAKEREKKSIPSFPLPNHRLLTGPNAQCTSLCRSRWFKPSRLLGPTYPIERALSPPCCASRSGIGAVLFSL